MNEVREALKKDSGREQLMGIFRTHVVRIVQKRLPLYGMILDLPPEQGGKILRYLVSQGT